MSTPNKGSSPLRPSSNKGAESRNKVVGAAATISPNRQARWRGISANGAERKAGGNPGAFWIFALCFMSILFAALSSRQLPAMRIMSSVPEDAYRHLYYHPTNIVGGGTSGGVVGGQEAVVADDVNNNNDRDDDADDDDSVDAEGFYVDSADERENNFNNGLWDDDRHPHGDTNNTSTDASQSDEPPTSGGTEEHDHRKKEEDDDGPWVAQLLSYPNSGTSYTLMNTWLLANRTTATGKGGADPHDRLALRPDKGYGAPYVARPDLLPHSKGLVLTKAHCDGHCFTCRPASTMTEEFELKCRAAAWTDGSYHKDHYGMDIVKGFVHLVRDPLDNCVSRMHHGLKTAKPDDERVDEIRIALADNPVSGLDGWCAYLDEISRPYLPAAITGRDDAHELLSIPCHAEFIRYVAWHNAAYKMTEVKYAALPTYRLYYENYTANYDGVVRELYQDFLKYPPTNAPPKPFIAGKTYHFMFSPQHQLDIAHLVQSLALPPVWEMLRHYFADFRTFDYTTDGRNRTLALLLSFPNSVRTISRAPFVARLVNDGPSSSFANLVILFFF